MKEKIQNFLNTKQVSLILIFLIIANMAVFIFDTDKIFHRNYSYYIRIFETASVAIFTLEYFLRIISLNKIKDLFQPLLVIDLIAILPFYLSFLHLNTIFLRALRLTRLFRLFKLNRYTHAFENIKQSFIKRTEITTTTTNNQKIKLKNIRKTTITKVVTS